jgi:hypothetical protein
MYHLQLYCNYQQNQASISKKGTRQTHDKAKISEKQRFLGRYSYYLLSESNSYLLIQVTT